MLTCKIQVVNKGLQLLLNQRFTHMKKFLSITFFGFSVFSQQQASAAAIAGFEGVVDDFYEGISLRFTLDPTVGATPLGVDSFFVRINGVGTTENPFNGGEFVIDTFVPSFSPDGTSVNPASTPDFLGPDQIVIHFPKIESATLLDITIFFGKNNSFVDYSGGGAGTILPFTVDLIVNPAFGTNPSALGQQDFLSIASQDNYQLGYVGVPEPQSPLLVACGLVTWFSRRRRNR